MAPVSVKDAKVWRQTKALLYKNYLVKLRTKKTSIQEILLPLFVLMLLMFLSMMHPNKHYDAMPSSILGSLHEYVSSDISLGYTPVNNLTNRLMQLAYTDCLPRAKRIEQFSDEEALKDASIAKQETFVGIIFKDAMSYQLRLFPDLVPVTKFYTDSRANCHIQDCESAAYLHSAFTSLQACIDSSIIKLKTNYSVWNELKSTKVILMGEPAMMEIDTVPRTIILFYLVMAFSPFGYYVATHVVAEKEKKLKEFMKMMGLHDTAFWLSWVLLYSSFIFIMSLLMAIIVTVFSPFPNSNYFLIFALFFFYGISLIFFALMLTPFFKKAKHVGVVEFLATLVFGCIGLLIVLVEDFPKPYVWLLSPFCHCTFLIGIAQVMHLEDQETGALFSNLKDGPCPLIITFVFLVVDSTIYLLLAIYLDQVLPGEYGLRRSPLFFLTPSYWSKKTRNYSELDEGSVNRNLNVSEMAEPVSEEFHGKAAIRIAGVQKTFRKKDENVEALRGLSFDIYEGQITALLGHSGTGKTTLMNILCGLCPVSEGVTTIYGHKVSEFDEMLEVRKMTGICPQMDILFDVLTVEENLSVFATIKGIDHKRTEQEVHSVLQDLDIHSIKDNQAVKLSGGQKRKLSLGVAILGNPKVLLLDEPTAGMDPCSRHVVWNVLKNRKADRVTVFSTHFMDEADIIADRKAVISQGMLKCIGSSLFLKSKWGVGYRLSLDINKDFDVEALTSLIKGHIAGADLLQQHEHEIVYALPFKEMDKFSALFSDLDSHNNLGVLTYGVSMTTLEDVFLKLEVEAEIDQADYSVFNQQQQQPTDDDLDRKSLDEMEQSLLMLSESKPFAAGSPALYRQQTASVARFHFLNLKRENKSLRVVLLLLLIFLALQMVMFLLHRYFRSVVGPVRFSPDLYFLKPGQESNRFLTSLLLQNSTGSSIDDVVDSLRSQNIAVDMMNGTDYVAVSPHNAALNVLRFEKVYVFEAIFNSTMVHSLPVLVNIISNLALDSLNVTQSIQTASNPFFQEITETVFKLELYFQAAILGIIVTGMPPYFAMENADSHKMRVYSQLKMAGLYPSAYWLGQAVVDLPLFLLILIVMMGSLFAFHFGVYFYADQFIAVVFCLIGYVPAVILFTYVISFTYRKVHNTQEFWSFIFSVTSLLTVVITEVTYFIGNDFITTILHDLFSVFIPIYPLVGCLICFIKISWKGAQNTDSPWSRLFISVISPYVQCVVLLYVLRYLELKNGGRSIRQDPFFRACRKKIKVWTSSEAPNDEDDDVRAERAMVSEMMTSDNCEEKPAILVNSLYKEYDEKKNPLLGRKIKKLATKNVTLSVRKGEILGLLGPNGAGKSTLINLLVGVTEPTAGQVLLGEHAVTGHEGNSPTSFVGYCPQTNPLWPEITLQEHLEVFGAIKGMSVHDLKEVIKRVASALDLKEHLQKPSKKMSAGIKRKLCFALSMLGNPHIVLLDEPSTGMDPKAKQQMWRAVRTAFKGKDRAAILTTHYMEEADAVCDRVAIMVSGQLRCIGSVQHLKSKFGRKYFLDMKLKECEEGHKMELLQREIEHIFPHACRQESFASILSYKIPKEDVQSLSVAFCKLEEAKQAFNIEEYSLSQSTLEQVFVEFAKEQEVEDDHFATMNSSLWWERSQEDRVIF